MMDRAHITVTFMKWTRKPRCTLNRVECNFEEFVNIFICNVQELLPHAFVAKKQALYLSQVQNDFKKDECVIICDFAENYVFVVQKAIARFY